MAKFIKTIVDRINLLNRKGLSPYYSPEQICEEVHAASLDLYKKHVADFERTQLISVYLDPFRSIETVAISNGSGVLDTSKGKYKTAVMIGNTQVTQGDHSHWPSMVNDSVRVPSETYPICRIDNAIIVVRPITVTSVNVYFLRVPVKPVFAYDLVDDDYIYNDAASTDIEWSEICHPDIIGRVFAGLGLSQREAALVQFSDMEKQTEGR